MRVRLLANRQSVKVRTSKTLRSVRVRQLAGGLPAMHTMLLRSGAEPSVVRCIYPRAAEVLTRCNQQAGGMLRLRLGVGGGLLAGSMPTVVVLLQLLLQRGRQLRQRVEPGVLVCCIQPRGRGNKLVGWVFWVRCHPPGLVLWGRCGHRPGGVMWGRCRHSPGGVLSGVLWGRSHNRPRGRLWVRCRHPLGGVLRGRCCHPSWGRVWVRCRHPGGRVRVRRHPAGAVLLVCSCNRAGQGLLMRYKHPAWGVLRVRNENGAGKQVLLGQAPSEARGGSW